MALSLENMTLGMTLKKKKKPFKLTDVLTKR